MASEEDNTDAVYGDEYLAEEDDVSEEIDDNQSLQFQPIDEDEDIDLIDDEEEDVDLIDDEEDDSGGELTSAAVAATGIPAVTVTTATITAATPISQLDTIPEVRKPLPLPVDDSRRLFQRLWTDEDEIELLQGFLDYTTQRGTNGSSHHHHDTAAFYDQIKGKLQLDFNKNQLVEKIRRLKKKYRNVLSKISSGKEFVFKTPHDQATFEISCKIWNENTAAVNAAEGGGNVGGVDEDEVQNPNPNLNSNVAFNLNDNNNGNESEMKVPRSRKRARTSAVKIEENYEQQEPKNFPNVTESNLVEETVKSCLLPLFKELVSNSSNVACGSSKGLTGLGLMNMNSFSGPMSFGIGDMSDEKWRKQYILELEVYSKRLELMQDQIQAKLDELKSI